MNSDVVKAIHRFTLAFDEYVQGNYELARDHFVKTWEYSIDGYAITEIV